MSRWFSRWRRSGGAKEARDDALPHDAMPHDRKGRTGRKRVAAANKGRRKAKTRRQTQPSPLTWNEPNQDLRYGDPFDG